MNATQEEAQFWVDRCLRLEAELAAANANLSEQQAILDGLEKPACYVAAIHLVAAQEQGQCECFIYGDSEGLQHCRPLYTKPALPAVPEGWQLVPIEPTWEMTRPGFGFNVWKCGCGTSGGLSHNKLTEIYKAMLKAAPSQTK